MSDKLCSIYKCFPNPDDIRYCFPNPKVQLPLFRKWMGATGNSEIGLLTPDQIYSQYKVCQKHFQLHHIDNELKLLDGAFPTLHLPYKETKTVDLFKIENNPRNVSNEKLYCLEFTNVENGKTIGLFQLKGTSKTDKEVDYTEDLTKVFNFITNVEVKRVSKSLYKYKNICVCRICLKAIRLEEAQTLIGYGMRAKHVERMLRELVTIDLTLTKNPALCQECVNTIAEAYSFKMVCKSNEDKIRVSLTPHKKIVDLFELTNQSKLLELYETMEKEQFMVKNGYINSTKYVVDEDPDGVINTIEIYEQIDTNATDDGEHGHTNTIYADKHGDTNKKDADKHRATNNIDADKHGATNKMDANKHGATNIIDANKHGATNNMDADKRGAINKIDADKHGTTNVMDADKHGTTSIMDADKHGTTNKMDADKHGTTNTTDVDKHGATNEIDADQHGITNEIVIDSRTLEITVEMVRKDIDNIDYSNHLSDLEDHWYEERYKADDVGLEEKLCVVGEKSVNDFLRDHDYNASPSELLIKIDGYPKTLPPGDDILSHKFDYLFEKKKTSVSLKPHRMVLRNRMRRLGRIKLMGTGPFLCEICGHVINHPAHKYLALHIYIKHSNEGQFKCDTCGKSFRKNSSLYAHQRAVHVDRIRCKCCDKVFESKRSYLQHKKYKSGRSFQCHVCGKSVLSYGNFYAHMKSHSSQKKKFSCHICDRKFSWKTGVKKHMVYHHNKGEYECKICGKILNYERSLEKHVQIVHHNKGDYKCKICDVTFYKSETLKSHMKKIHEIGQAGRFRCSFCYKTYFTKRAYEQHVLIQHGENVGNLLVCQICQYKVKTEQNLEKHCKEKHTVYAGEPIPKTSKSGILNSNENDEDSDVQYFSC